MIFAVFFSSEDISIALLQYQTYFYIWSSIEIVLHYSSL